MKLGGDTPVEIIGGGLELPISLKTFRWQTHYRVLYLLPASA